MINELDKSLQELKDLFENIDTNELKEKYIEFAEKLGCSVEGTIGIDLNKITRGYRAKMKPIDDVMNKF